MEDMDFCEEFERKTDKKHFIRYNKGYTLFSMTDDNDLYHLEEEVINTDFIKVKEWYEEG